jgi:hypothetical protein
MSEPRSSENPGRMSIVLSSGSAIRLCKMNKLSDYKG